MIETVNLTRKFELIEGYWNPGIAGELNDSYIKLAKLKGEFIWHHHALEDEMFLVVKGTLVIKLRERDIQVSEGEFVIIPRGIEHMPVAVNEVHVLLIEPKTTVNTGSAGGDRTVDAQWI